MNGQYLQQFLDEFTDEEKAEIETRYKILREEYVTLQDLRKAQELTQQNMAATLHMRQENISRLEKRSDMMISTLSSYVQAMGGDLKLVAEFPGRRPVVLQGISDLTASQEKP